MCLTNTKIDTDIFLLLFGNVLRKHVLEKSHLSKSNMADIIYIFVFYIDVMNKRQGILIYFFEICLDENLFNNRKAFLKI